MDVEAKDETMGGDSIHIFVCNPGSTLPLITAIINMPLPEVAMQASK